MIFLSGVHILAVYTKVLLESFFTPFLCLAVIVSLFVTDLEIYGLSLGLVIFQGALVALLIAIFVAIILYLIVQVPPLRAIILKECGPDFLGYYGINMFSRVGVKAGTIATGAMGLKFGSDMLALKGAELEAESFGKSVQILEKKGFEHQESVDIVKDIYKNKSNPLQAAIDFTGLGKPKPPKP